MIISDSRIYKNKVKEIPPLTLLKDLTLNEAEKACLKDNLGKLTIIGIIDKEIAKPDNGVERIYLIEVQLKDDCVPITFMTAFDMQTKAHTIFEVPWGANSIYYMANKTIKDGVVISMGSYYGTDPEHELMIDINDNETLSDIYANLYSFVIGLRRREDETATDLENRSKKIKKLEKQVAKLERMSAKELNSNKRMEYNKNIRNLLEEIEREE